MKIDSPHLVVPHSKVKLSRVNTDSTGAFKNSDETDQQTDKQRKRLDTLQETLYAGATNGLLIVLQGMDTSGKDGTVSHIFSGINPQGCNVASFKVPTPLEARHDFLWRCHAQVPARGMIGIFNRSHYEDVLSPRVHGLMNKKEAHAHMEEINNFESTLVDNGIAILKFFLHISADEQARRLQSRIDDPDKHWKLSAGDFEERKLWPKYQQAYEDILDRTSTRHAPWLIIPADHKWYRNAAILDVIVQQLEGMKLKYPAPTADVTKLKIVTIK